MRADRLIATAVLVAALTPGLWWRNPLPPLRENHSRIVRVERLAAATPDSWPRELRLVGAWHLSSANIRFGGYSALLATGDNTLTATSDVGGWVRMARPGRSRTIRAEFGVIPQLERHEFDRDIEATTADPATGREWLAYEGINAIERLGPGKILVEVRPRAMRGWPLNGGPEAMVRLADGRFVVVSEDPPWLSTGERPGLLFPADPVEGAKPMQFLFRPPIGYHPSDMAPLPDGRVVILLRTLDPPFPPFFKGMLIVADPAAIAAGKEWPWQKLADLSSPLPLDNYEGLAIIPDAAGVRMWLISDSNFARFQRTLLLELQWDMPPRKTAA